VRRRMTAEYFEHLYGRDDDPWDFATSDYESRKYEATLAATDDLAPIGRALEVGCSIGVLTARLAGRCDELVAVDCSPRAVARARERLARVSGVTVEHRCMPESIPGGPFDLVLCSEVLYYWDAGLLREGLRLLRERLAPGGALLAVHWRGPVRHYPLDGEEAHRVLLAEAVGLVHARSERRPGYLLDRLDRPAA
jgi:SAM-dependent methyltransferase